MAKLWTQKEPAEKSKAIAAACGLGLLAVASIVSYLLFGKKLAAFFGDPQALKFWLDSMGIWSRVVFVLIRALQTVVKFIPAEPLEIGAGYAFGIWGGLLYCMLGTMLGSTVIILLTKRFGMRLVRLFVSDKKLESLSFLQDSARLTPMLFWLYLIPGTPKDIITYLICFTSMKISTFLLVTGVARIPSIVSSTWCGAQITSGNYHSAALIFAATTVVSFAGMAIYKAVQNKKKQKMPPSLKEA